MGQDNEPSMFNTHKTRTSTNPFFFPETYRYNETPVYTASNGCPVRYINCLFPNRIV